MSNITRSQYYMGVAEMIKLRSKDPVTKVGSCIVMNDRIISTGYNGFPNGLSDDSFPWVKGNDDETKNKFFYVVHSELNAIISAKQSLMGSEMYVTLFPCNECAKAIIQAGIKKIIYYTIDESTDKKKSKVNAVKKMFDAAGVEYEQYSINGEEIKIII